MKCFSVELLMYAFTVLLLFFKYIFSLSLLILSMCLERFFVCHVVVDVDSLRHVGSYVVMGYSTT